MKRILVALGLTIAGFVLTSTVVAAHPFAVMPSVKPAKEQVIPEVDVNCLAINLYHEARGEELYGIIAAGFVVVNRRADKHYPNSICKVIFQGGEKRRNKCQFSWWCDGRPDQPKNKVVFELMKVFAKIILRGKIKDPTNGSLMYHADYVDPYWRTSYKRERKIGAHIFYTRV